MHDIFNEMFGKNNPFKGGTPSINMFFMSAPEKKKEKNDEESTLKQILKSSKSIEAGQSQVSHVGGD